MVSVHKNYIISLKVNKVLTWFTLKWNNKIAHFGLTSFSWSNTTHIDGRAKPDPKWSIAEEGITRRKWWLDQQWYGSTNWESQASQESVRERCWYSRWSFGLDHLNIKCIWVNNYNLKLTIYEYIMYHIFMKYVYRCIHMLWAVCFCVEFFD